ncbi:hypothetical protein [Hymenobacter koreensis]|uniref:Energy transducer TonB n=1 Tax=Hymenobacter koreensis TaxID=1084523 RepID=A0ABP8J7G5_9BACT
MAVEFREEHRREALIGTLAFHGLLALLFFLIVFKNPPEDIVLSSGGGVELNYGLDEAGSGDIQTTAPANDSPNREDSRPPAQQPDPEPQPAVRTPPVAEQPAEEKILTSDAEENDVKIPPVEKPAERPREEPVKPAEPEKPKVDRRAVFTPRGSATGGGNGTSGTSNSPSGNNNGDKPGTVGDQGSPEGTLDGRALYGSPGSGGGTGGGDGMGDGFGNSGWAFENTPRVEPLDNEGGYVRLKIKIDEDGEIVSVTKVGSNMSPRQVQACIDAVSNKATFRRVKGGTGGATGFYTYRFRVE